MASPKPVPHAGRGLGFERFLFFSDAVFAIAITLLVLTLRPSFRAGGGFALGPLVPNLIGFGLSFYVVGRYWLAHHQLFESIQAYDRRLLRMNLLFLAGIVFLPFPTSVVTAAKPQTGAVVFYDLSVAAVGVLMIALVLVARRPALMKTIETRGATVRAVTALAAAPAVFLASAALAVTHPREGLLLLFALYPAVLAGDRLGGVLQRRFDRVSVPKSHQRENVQSSE